VTHDAAAALDAAWREHWARLLASLVAELRRPDLAEDALADAFAAAARTWPSDGVPRSPAAWLRTAARRRALDVLRAEAVAARKEPLLVVDARTRDLAGDLAPAAGTEDDDGAHIPDERLRLVFACAHPALTPDDRVALTLRFVGGLAVPDVARLFLVQESAMAARLTRAKKRLVAAGIPFSVPPAEQLDERLDLVATVLYLSFTAGYAPGTGPDVVRVALAGEAIRLGHLLDALLPERPVVRALLALMVLQHSRRDARASGSGALVRLADQDRARWHRDEIAEGLALVRTVPTDAPGLAREYLLQARIAAEHAVAALPDATDWPTIADLYAELEALTGNPVVRLARAVAVAEADGPDAGLALLANAAATMPRDHRPAAARGELLANAGRYRAAATALREAAGLCRNDAERAHLERRAAEVGALAPGQGSLGPATAPPSDAPPSDRAGVRAD
jgi:RNA polymerase sigma-70 factor (ECF subfamily)